MNARDFALLAQEAYDAVPDIGKAGSASRAIVRTTPAGLCVAFPVTNNAECWLSDLDALAVTVPGVGKVHRGFWLAWKAISAPVLAAIAERPVTFVGHSLGAALAVCAAVEMTIAGKPPVAVFGFEPPRVSPDLGVRTLLVKVPVTLYKNGNDLVPDVPFGWNHPGLPVRIGKASLPFPNIKDHAMVRVLQALTDIAESQLP
jgi:triacylglycerol lipase